MYAVLGQFILLAHWEESWHVRILYLPKPPFPHLLVWLLSSSLNHIGYSVDFSPDPQQVLADNEFDMLFGNVSG
jgi:hypothetical protein